MKPDEIKTGETYQGGKNGERRTVIRCGSSEDWLVWGLTRERLPLGGFVNTRCTSRASFAKWVSRPTPEHKEE